MSRELICTWLKLPPDRWPPDHYTLVGLDPGESDAARIEQHFHERHEWLLRYQLAHPEAVTEALNRLAQAFVCLTDPQAKQAYDRSLFPEREAPTSAPPLPPNVETPSLADPLAWLYGSWSPPASEAAAAPATPRTPTEDRAPPSEPVPSAHPSANGIPPPPPPELSLADEPEDPVVRVAGSPAARRGLGTKRALYYRISRTRQLLRSWIAVGRYVGDASFALQKRSDAVALRRQLDLIRDLLHGFPPLLGQAGQPGYLVIALARQPMIVQTFLALLPSQREALVRDWQAGLTLLAAHRLVLREEIWTLRRRGWIGRLRRTLGAVVTEHLGLWLLLFVVAAINGAILPVMPSIVPVVCLEVGIILSVLGVYLLLRSLAPRRSWLHRRERSRLKTVR